MSSKLKIATLGAMLTFAFAVPSSFAQNQGGGGGGNGGGGNGGGGGGGGNGGGGGGGGNRGNFRQQMQDRLKTALGMTDDEFTAVQPKIEKVQQLQREAMGGMFGRGGRGGRNRGGDNNNGGNGGQDANQSAVQTASADLQKTLDDKDAKPEDIKDKLEALRTAKKAAKEDLGKAQDDLKSVLTQRQEAVLVEYGMLE
jgi:hypothetical protein